MGLSDEPVWHPNALDLLLLEALGYAAPRQRSQLRDLVREYYLQATTEMASVAANYRTDPWLAAECDRIISDSVSVIRVELQIAYEPEAPDFLERLLDENRPRVLHAARTGYYYAVKRVTFAWRAAAIRSLADRLFPNEQYKLSLSVEREGEQYVNSD